MDILTLAVDAMMAFIRLRGCARCVPSSTSVMLTWLPRFVASVAPASRSDTGIAVTNDLVGRLWCLSK